MTKVTLVMVFLYAENMQLLQAGVIYNLMKRSSSIEAMCGLAIYN